MFAHVKGYKHREKYLGMKYNFVSEDKRVILAEAKVKFNVFLKTKEIAEIWKNLSG